MPTSIWTSLSFILNEIMKLSPTPQSVLDVGLGSGKYGFLCREYLTYWNSPVPRRITIHGIEAFPDYITPLQKQIYDEIFIGDALSILGSLGTQSYDLLLLIDVLEHFEKTVGHDLLRECQRVAKAVIVSTPSQFWPQGENWGNAAEKHLCLWTKHELKKCGARRVFKKENWIGIFVRPPYDEPFRLRVRLWRLAHKLFPTI